MSNPTPTPEDVHILLLRSRHYISDLLILLDRRYKNPRVKPQLRFAQGVYATLMYLRGDAPPPITSESEPNP